MRWIHSVMLAVGFGAFLCDRAHSQPTVADAPKPPAPLPPATLQAPPSNPFGPPPRPPLDNVLAFDAEEKEVTVTNGTTEAHFAFNLTNISSGDVTIFSVTTSCHCTVAELPSTPWKLSPNESGTISATMDLFGVPPGGDKTKTLTISTDKGTKYLYAKAIVMPGAMAMVDRTNAQKIAMANRQAVFQGDCASCHVAPARDATGHDRMGKDLYVAVCGVCHDAEHRASFVPDLHHLSEPTNPEFWRGWIANGKLGTLMPAFSKPEGGFLSDAQIESLVVYLDGAISPHPAGMANSAN